MKLKRHTLIFLIFLTLMVGYAVVSPPVEESRAAGGNSTVSFTKITESLYKISVAWIADDGDGTVPAVPLTQYSDILKNSEIIYSVTNPNGGPPTDNYDITLTDSSGADRFGGAMANCDNVTREAHAPTIDGVYVPVRSDGNLTSNITGQSMNSANGTTEYYVKPLRY